ncbi:MAG: N-methyl-L-tryptophan oxidase [Acidobacteria bacterium]|nr:N-methyl-L-tryptophan oxidase [Acidobacteriota bacterium]
MYDAIVIGVGGMGSATLYHLARGGARVLGLEQFGIPHAFGSSHGSTRIIRLAYSEGPEYVPLLRAAYRYWRELEAVSGRSILQITGGLDIGPEGSWTIEGSRQSCVEHGLAFEELGGMEVNRRFPGYRLPDAMRAVYQPDGGYVRSEDAIEAFAAAAQAAGAEIVTDATVRGWERRGAGWRVHAAGERYDARKLVITAGPWVGALVPDLRPVCRPERQVMLWTEPLRADRFQPGRFPVFNMESPSGRYYGFPDDRGEGFKIGRYYHLRQQVTDPNRLDRECHPEDEAVLREGVAAYFPEADGPTRRMAACLFTNTPDTDFILDRAPGLDDVFVAAGFSGHGFKFCSVVGRILADFCLDRPPQWDLGRFRLGPDRFR